MPPNKSYLLGLEQLAKTLFIWPVYGTAGQSLNSALGSHSRGSE
jgi:hypothetical protein